MKTAILTALVTTAALVYSNESGAGRGLWYPIYAGLIGQRTHTEVLAEIAPSHRAPWRDRLSSLGVAYPPSKLTLVGLKEEKRLEVWVADRSDWRLLETYPVLAASGGAGPKLREGDRQVPEGIYRLTGFNPNSSYHLSIRVDYPNADDTSRAATDGRTGLGGDIFIHGKAVSIGCLAIGDRSIEELYLLLADTRLKNTRLILVPNAEPDSWATDDPSPTWLGDLYAELHRELVTVRGAAP